MKYFLYTLSLVLLTTSAHAEDPQVVDVRVEQQGMAWRVDVTLQHPDTGWDHYADGWEALDAEGNRLGYRELLHPHVNEQPFTRSLSNVIIPDGTREIFIRASCSVDEWASEKISVLLAP